MQVSRTIVAQVLSGGVAMLCNDLPAIESFSDTASIIERRIHSVLAVPLEVFDRILGVIYLDASNPDARFDENHLQLLTAIGSIAAAALDNARRMEALEQENRRLQDEISLEHNMVGDSPRMRDVYQFIARVAPRDITVLILRRKRDRQGTGGARHPPHQRPRQQTVRGDQLRRAGRKPARKRAVRPRERARSPAPSPRKKASSKSPRAARFSWTKSASWRRCCKPSCCACCRSANSSAWAARAPSSWMCA